MGVHNGVITNHTKLNQTYVRECRVDSQHIFQHIADELPLTDLEGNGTIVYYQDDEFRIGKFNGGVLSVYRNNLGLFFASTEPVLKKALRYAGLMEESKEVVLVQNTLYRLDTHKFKLRRVGGINIAPSATTWRSTVSRESGGVACAKCKTTCYVTYKDPEAPYGEICYECRYPYNFGSRAGWDDYTSSRDYTTTRYGAHGSTPYYRPSSGLPEPAYTPAYGTGRIYDSEGHLLPAPKAVSPEENDSEQEELVQEICGYRIEVVPEKTTYFCSGCSEPIHAGEPCGTINGEVHTAICEDCLDEVEYAAAHPDEEE